MQDRLTGVDRPHRSHHLCGGDVFQQVSGSPCGKECENVLIVIVLSQDEHCRAWANGLNLPRRLDAVHHRHGDIEDHDMWLHLLHKVDRLGSVTRFPYDLDVWLLLEQLARRFADKGVILCDYHADLPSPHLHNLNHSKPPPTTLCLGIQHRLTAAKSASSHDANDSLPAQAES